MKTNIIFIIVDTLRADALGIYGNKKKTPNIDRLARQGVVFNNAYASTTKTDPSISSIFSGQYPQSMGLISHGQWISQEEKRNIKKTKLLAEILQSNDYRTIAVDWLSRWHKRGFDVYSGKIIPDTSTESLIIDKFFYLKYFRKIDRLFLVKFLKRDFLTRIAFSFFLNNPIPYDPADVVVDQAIDYLNGRQRKNFFLYFHFWDPHWPHVRPKGLKSFLFNTVVDRYLAEVNFVDNQLGRFFTYLQKENLLAETLIVFTGDHGESLTEHGLFIAHQGLYEQVVKVPLIFYHHQFHQKKKINALVAHVDIFPTILELLGIKPEKEIDGQSLLPLIAGKTKKVREFVFFEDVVFGQMKIKKAKRRRGVRAENYKYLQYLKINNRNISQPYLGKEAEVFFEELFDLKKDPQEEENLAFFKIKEKEHLKFLLEKFLDRLREKISYE